MHSVASLLISLGVIFLAALACDVLGRRTWLPRVTLLISFGFLAGPAGLAFFPDITQSWFPVVADMALLMVGFLLGGRLTGEELRQRGGQVLRLSLAVVLVTFGVVAAGLWLVGAPVTIAIVLAALATATDPAATFDVVHETGAETSFSRTLLDIVAIDDAWGILVFSLALAASELLAGGAARGALVHGAWDLGGALLLGVGLGVPMALLSGRLESGEPTLYEALGMVFLCGGAALWLEVSFLLSAMVMGAVVVNLARHHTRPFHAIEGIEWPFMILFFVLAGASLDPGALLQTGGWLVAFIGLRIVGRLGGGWLGGSLPPADPEMRRWLGAALLPQAGVALGMALVAAQRFPEIGDVILPIVVAATAIFELIGPIATRVALRGAARESGSGG